MNETAGTIPFQPGSMYPPVIKPGQTPDEAFIRAWFNALVAIYGQRNGEYRVLRGVFDGSFRINPAFYPSTQLLKESSRNPFNDRVDLVYNVANATVRRYMDSMSQPPRVDGVPEGLSEEEIELADKRAKFIDYIWNANSMPIKLIEASYYQALLDKAIFNLRPAPHLPHKIKIELAVPDYYLPLTRGDDWRHPLAVVYGFRTFENADFMRNPMTFNGDPVFNTVIEYWDHNWFVRLENGKQPIVIQHGLGFIPWYECHNLPIPHRFRGQGDIDQAIGLNEYLNMLMSAMGDMIAYAANPIAVVRGTKVGGTNLPFTSRAVWELERDAQVGFLQWQGAPPSVEAQILRTMQAIEDTTGVSSPAFGREIPSGTSGNAVRSLLAGFNTRLGTKQQLMGDMLVRMNAGILAMAEKMFPNEKFRLSGENLRPGRDFGKRTTYEFQPKEMKGWHKTKVIFQPLDPTSTYFQEMDKFQKGVQSRYTTLKALGVQYPHDEIERIRIEKEGEAEHENNMAMAKQGRFMPSDVRAKHEAQTGDLLNQIKSLAQPKGPQGLLQGASDKGNEQRKDKRDLTKAVQAPIAPGSSEAQPNAPQGESQLAEPDFKMSDLLGKFRDQTFYQGLSGRAMVTGEIYDKGKGGGTILLDNMDDAERIKQILGPNASKFNFQKIDPNKPAPTEATTLYDPSKGAKKKSTEFRNPESGYLSVIVLNKESAGKGGVVLTIGIRDDKGSVVPIGKTDAQRRIVPQQGELIRVKVGQLSRREDNGIKWGISQTVPVPGMAQAKPSSFKDVERIWEASHA